MENLQGPIDHTKLLRKWGGYKIKHSVWCQVSKHFSARAFLHGRRSALGTSEGLPDVRASGDPIGWAPRGGSWPLSSLVRCGMYFPLGARAYYGAVVMGGISGGGASDISAGATRQYYS
jgi:hypothetical protein